MKAFAYKMTPAFHHGAKTPWGGESLKTLFGKNIPDACTGESLECSTLPGEESRAADGRTLTEIAGGPLPLLLMKRVNRPGTAKRKNIMTTYTESRIRLRGEASGAAGVLSAAGVVFS